MNTSVDVLSILDDAEGVLRMDHYKAIPDDLQQARAAVAELIEASEFFVNDRSGYTDLRMREAKLAKLGAALLNVKGA